MRIKSSRDYDLEILQCLLFDAKLEGVVRERVVFNNLQSFFIHAWSYHCWSVDTSHSRSQNAIHVGDNAISLPRQPPFSTLRSEIANYNPLEHYNTNSARWENRRLAISVIRVPTQHTENYTDRRTSVISTIGLRKNKATAPGLHTNFSNSTKDSTFSPMLLESSTSVPHPALGLKFCHNVWSPTLPIRP